MSAGAESQRGAALLVVLIMLVIVGLVAVTGAQDSQLQTKMSINNHAYEQAYYHAETVLAMTEKRLQYAEWQLSAFNNSDGLFVVDQDTPSIISTTNSSSSISNLQAILKENGKPVSDSGNKIGFYLIEYLGRAGEAPLNPAIRDPRLNAFRITAMGQAGVDNKAWAVVQSELRLEPFLGEQI